MLISMDRIDDLLTRAVDDIIPSKKELEDVLRSGAKLRVYQGFDPSTPNLHIGHMIGLRKLRDWQRLGHEVIFLIGDFTGRIGDPTGKDESRPLLSKDVVDKNAKTYKTQASKILRFDGKNPVKIKFNSEWLDKLSTAELLNLLSQVTYQQVIKRDMYQKRIQEGKDISVNEVTYPIMQGYDSVAMDVDVEVGGCDQLFNMMMGRDLMHKLKRKNKFVMTTKLLVDAQGNKIGKTTGNAVNFTDPADEIFGTIMSFPDDVVVKGIEYLTDVPTEEIEKIQKAISGGTNPIEFKKRLAFEIVEQLSSENEAQNAQEEFEAVHQKGDLPQDIETQIEEGTELIDVLTRLSSSKSQAKRLLDQKAVEVDGKTTQDGKIKLKKGQVLKIGKRLFAQVK